ncbi:hypothetical protein QBC41DRAFT_379482 [Cercophora samala]|uniref:Uncharacterized protein n=1 Tax=Cercophora samala TaxID=330535 RepID=A0AA39ZKW5_9PEZI|nr:hypothetical protein QBC41DRAFT_379482 [Cercophora samala]
MASHDGAEDSEDDQWVGYCVPRRCRLCTFPIEDEEMMVAAAPGSSRVSRPFVNEETNIVHEVSARPEKGELREEFRPCLPRCTHDQANIKGPATGYHAECFDYAGKSFGDKAKTPPSPDFFGAMEFSFEPMPLYDLRRRKKAEELIARKLGAIWSFLPHEICLMIAPYLVQEYTIGRLHALSSSRCRSASPSKQLDTSNTVWARYINIGGIEYVHNLSNKKQEHYRKVFNPATSPDVDLLYVLEDPLGVRSLIFSNSKEKKLQPTSVSACTETGEWWRVITLCSPTLEIEHDGIKVRRIHTASSPNIAHELWPVPIHPEEIAALKVHKMTETTPNEPRHETLQIFQFQINGPGVTGYSFCWSNGFLFFYTHHEGEDIPVNMYRDCDQMFDIPLWTHVPVEPDEFITSMYMRHSSVEAESCLWIRTSIEREYIIGPPISTSTQTTWSRIFGPLSNNHPNHPVPSYFALSHTGIKHLAIPQSSTPSHGPWIFPPTLPTALGPDDPDYEFSRWLGSSALLSNLAEITPYRHPPSPTCHPLDSQIQGLGLVYLDGRRAHVGQVRLDLATTPIDVRNASSIHLAVHKREYVIGVCYVTELRLDPPSLSERESAWRWIDIDLSNEEDSLLWLYFGYANALAYREQVTWEEEEEEGVE